MATIITGEHEHGKMSYDLTTWPKPERKDLTWTHIYIYIYLIHSKNGLTCDSTSFLFIYFIGKHDRAIFLTFKNNNKNQIAWMGAQLNIS